MNLSTDTFEVFEIAADEAMQDILIAELSEIGFDNFVQSETVLTACILTASYAAVNDLTQTIFERYHIAPASVKQEQVVQTNWNETWEQNFEPVWVADKVYVRALFHPEKPEAIHTITIQPKMSFGTGHHGTTSGMIELMLSTDFQAKRVLDMGTGTGILAILAEQLGASSILGIDYDEWAIQNALENCAMNNCKTIQLELGDEKNIGDQQFDVILSNITLNYNLANLNAYATLLTANGELMMSGFYDKDISTLLTALPSSLTLIEQKSYQNWAAIKFKKQA